MKRFLTLMLTALMVGLSALPCYARRYVADSIKVDGYMRHLEVYLPDGLQSDAPLVFMLHGYDAGILRDNPMIAAADRHGFAVCMPLALVGPKGETSWNVGYSFQQDWRVDDVKTLCRMAKHVQKLYRLSRENTFLVGFSNGGEMCYLMAYSKQSTFKAFASIAGMTMSWIYQQMDAPRPAPFMEIHGTKDRLSPWEGDIDNKGGWGSGLSVPVGINYWVAKNRCTHEVTERIESLKGDEGHRIIKHSYSGSPTGCDVLLYEVVDGVHSWHTGDINVGEEIWKFFSRYVKK